MDLDFWDCFGRKQTCLITENMVTLFCDNVLTGGTSPFFLILRTCDCNALGMFLGRNSIYFVFSTLNIEGSKKIKHKRRKITRDFLLD